jgi:hypothetical protein
MSEEQLTHQSISHISVQQGSRAYVGSFSDCTFRDTEEHRAFTVSHNLNYTQLTRPPNRSLGTGGRRVLHHALPYQFPRRPREPDQRKRHESQRHLRVDHTRRELPRVAEQQ